jgi:polyisoprenoid-binding protein YceI
MGTTRQLFLGLAALLLPALTWAQWEIDSDSSAINFISIKNDIVAETHSFGSLVGYIGGDGKVELAIDLDSVETLIPIRNERMRELLFETRQYPTANLSAQVDPGILQAAAQGGVVNTVVQVGLSLHGQDALLEVPVVVVGDDGQSLRVVSARPVIVNAGDFGLEAGVTALREIAGLKTISTAVPVTLNLLFNRASD